MQPSSASTPRRRRRNFRGKDLPVQFQPSVALILLCRAYVVSKSKLTPQEQTTFASSVQEWIKSRVARHKYLRGGVVIIDAVPKSAAGKILRRELRERAKAEVAAATPVKAKL